MLVVIASFLVGVAGLGRGPDAKFKQPNAPFAFSYAKDLHVSSHLDDATPAALLRDYSEDDNYRAFLVEVRARPLAADETLAGIGDALVAETKKKADQQDVLIVANTPVKFHDLPAQRVELEYTVTTERLDFTRPDGKERQTLDGPLHMRREAIIQVRGDTVYTLVLSASREQYARRRTQYETVTRTFSTPKPKTAKAP